MVASSSLETCTQGTNALDISLDTDQGSNAVGRQHSPRKPPAGRQIREVMVDSSLETGQGSNGWTAVWKQIRKVMIGQQYGNRSGK